jgi:hypothetical protein
MLAAKLHSQLYEWELNSSVDTQLGHDRLAGGFSISLCIGIMECI